MCHLCAHAIMRWHVWIWAVLLYGWGDIVKMFKGFFAKKGHGKVNFAIFVVPVKIDFDVFASCVINRDTVVFFECVNEMIDIIAR